MASYKVLVGIDYGDKRVEAGEVISDLPTKSVSWLKEQGLIEEVTATKPAGKNSKQSAVTEEEAE